MICFAQTLLLALGDSKARRVYLHPTDFCALRRDASPGEFPTISDGLCVHAGGREFRPRVGVPRFRMIVDRKEVEICETT